MKNQNTTILIVEDDKIPREILCYWASLLGIRAIWCDDPMKAYSILQKEKIHLIFLDINFPDSDCFPFVESLKDAPPIVLITGHFDRVEKTIGYLRGSKNNVFDLLTKPLKRDRFQESLQWMHYRPEPTGYRFLNSRKGAEKVRIQDIAYIESEGSYNKYYFSNSDKTYLIRETMVEAQEILPRPRFFKCNRSQIINAEKVLRVQDWTVSMQGQPGIISIAPNYRDEFKRLFF